MPGWGCRCSTPSLRPTVVKPGAAGSEEGGHSGLAGGGRGEEGEELGAGLGLGVEPVLRDSRLLSLGGVEELSADSGPREMGWGLGVEGRTLFGSVGEGTGTVGLSVGSGLAPVAGGCVGSAPAGSGDASEVGGVCTVDGVCKFR